MRASVCNLCEYKVNLLSYFLSVLLLIVYMSQIAILTVVDLRSFSAVGVENVLLKTFIIFLSLSLTGHFRMQAQ